MCGSSVGTVPFSSMGEHPTGRLALVWLLLPSSEGNSQGGTFCGGRLQLKQGPVRASRSRSERLVLGLARFLALDPE